MEQLFKTAYTFFFIYSFWLVCQGVEGGGGFNLLSLEEFSCFVMRSEREDLDRVWRLCGWTEGKSCSLKNERWCRSHFSRDKKEYPLFTLGIWWKGEGKTSFYIWQTICSRVKKILVHKMWEVLRKGELLEGPHTLNFFEDFMKDFFFLVSYDGDTKWNLTCNHLLYLVWDRFSCRDKHRCKWCPIQHSLPLLVTGWLIVDCFYFFRIHTFFFLSFLSLSFTF